MKPLRPTRVCTPANPPLQVLQDAFEAMNGLGEALHGRIRIQFVDAHGLEEAGVDGGGIFKEFIETVRGGWVCGWVAGWVHVLLRV